MSGWSSCFIWSSRWGPCLSLPRSAITLSFRLNAGRSLVGISVFTVAPDQVGLKGWSANRSAYLPVCRPTCRRGKGKRPARGPDRALGRARGPGLAGQELRVLAVRLGHLFADLVHILGLVAVLPVHLPNLRLFFQQQVVDPL